MGPGAPFDERRQEPGLPGADVIDDPDVSPVVGIRAQKNDTIDAEAIAEAVTRPTMRFTQIRSPEQVDLEALHRIRDQLVSSRTRLINQVRAFCLEYGVAIRKGAGVFRLDLPRVLADQTNDLTSAMRRMLGNVGLQ